MNKKQTIIAILLILAIIISSASVIMNTSLMNNLKTDETKEVTAEVSITILPNNEIQVLEDETG